MLLHPNSHPLLLAIHMKFDIARNRAVRCHLFSAVFVLHGEYTSSEKLVLLHLLFRPCHPIQINRVATHNGHEVDDNPGDDSEAAKGKVHKRPGVQRERCGSEDHNGQSGVKGVHIRAGEGQLEERAQEDEDSGVGLSLRREKERHAPHHHQLADHDGHFKPPRVGRKPRHQKPKPELKHNRIHALPLDRQHPDHTQRDGQRVDTAGHQAQGKESRPPGRVVATPPWICIQHPPRRLVLPAPKHRERRTRQREVEEDKRLEPRPDARRNKLANTLGRKPPDLDLDEPAHHSAHTAQASRSKDREEEGEDQLGHPRICARRQRALGRGQLKVEVDRRDHVKVHIGKPAPVQLEPPIHATYLEGCKSNAGSYKLVPDPLGQVEEKEHATHAQPSQNQEQGDDSTDSRLALETRASERVVVGPAPSTQPAPIPLLAQSVADTRLGPRALEKEGDVSLCREKPRCGRRQLGCSCTESARGAGNARLVCGLRGNPKPRDADARVGAQVGYHPEGVVWADGRLARGETRVVDDRLAGGRAETERYVCLQRRERERGERAVLLCIGRDGRDRERNVPRPETRVGHPEGDARECHHARLEEGGGREQRTYQGRGRDLGGEGNSRVGDGRAKPVAARDRGRCFVSCLDQSWESRHPLERGEWSVDGPGPSLCRPQLELDKDPGNAVRGGRSQVGRKGSGVGRVGGTDKDVRVWRRNEAAAGCPVGLPESGKGRRVVQILKDRDAGVAGKDPASPF